MTAGKTPAQGRKTTVQPSPTPTNGPVLLACGNPQIPMGDGDAPVQAYLDAMPGWKQRVGRTLDEIIVDAVPGVTKAVKWNTPFYGVAGNGFFTGFHCLTRYVKVSFFRGADLEPMPPGSSKVAGTRYLDIYEHDELDVELLTQWFQQAAALPGWKP